ncbi:TPD1 protein homolog 1A-like [Spinacia oleracea]|uniref:TPD1 protein homolog 1A-like n=1 Tax=Spinacia oleracea TaxID=3562 RepID=A0ABM3R6Z7_SPIOL|nr:TPD1 protein homolog 1A-like [Spinacia oleracea]
MASSLKIFSAVLFLFIICQQGKSYKCGVSDIKVTTERTRNIVEGQPEYAVTISNNCSCAQSGVYLRCLGFSTVLPVNPKVMKVKGDSCLINNGRPIVKGKPVSFKYSFLTPTDLAPQRSQISC